MKPSCFESEQQFSGWLQLFKVTNSDNLNFCQDCTPSYATAMRTCGRCEHPDFDINDPRLNEDMPVGSHPLKPRGRPIKIRVVPIDLVGV